MRVDKTTLKLYYASTLSQILIIAGSLSDPYKEYKEEEI
jgi:hypothetical protein